MEKETLSEGIVNIVIGQEIIKRTSWGKVRYIWLACSQCGKERWIEKKHLKRASYTGLCSHCYSSRQGEKRDNWIGGRVRQNKYILIWLPPDNFFYPMAKKRGYVLEHRLVMAKHLGRCLHSWEIIHHKNGIKDDNRFENLQLVTDDRHRQITILEVKIAHLEIKVDKLSEENSLLKWQIKELNRQVYQVKLLR